MTVAAGCNDWDPGTYHRFRGQRIRPALDLLHAVPSLPDAGDVADLGCGSGAAGPALKQLNRTLTGLDLSPAMLEEAEATGVYDRLLQGDLADWQSDPAFALIFSNAALHWAGDHAHLLPRLARALVPGGTLAVQMPHQNNAPSHRLWLTLVDEHFPGRYDEAKTPSILSPVRYHALLDPLGTLSMWETEYYQHLPASETGHPVREFTEATFARPILQSLNRAEQVRLIRLYESVIETVYPREADGSVLFPFRRLFFTLTV